MSKHTPGPWHIMNDDGGIVGATCPSGAPDIIADCNQHIESEYETDWANARLIAAAPEMFKAVQMALDYMDHSTPATCYDGTEYMRKTLRAILREIEGGE